VQQRNGRKSLCTIQGLPEEVDLIKLLKAFKKEFCCNGTIVDDLELGKIIQLQGDHRKKIKQFLIEEQIAQPTQVVLHGYGT